MSRFRKIVRPCLDTETGRRPRSDSGFTLAEVAISLTLLAMVMAGVFSTYVMGMRMIQDARDEVRASQIVQSEMEALRTYNWTDISSLSSSTVVTPQGKFVNKFANRYQLIRMVEAVNSSQKRVTFLVWWNNGRGLEIRRFATVVTRDGLNDYFYRSAQ